MRVLLLTFLLILCSFSSASALDFGILFFTSDNCYQCTVMKKAWKDKKVQDIMKLRELRFIPININELSKPILSWKIKHVPTTIIVELDGKRKVVRIVNRIQGLRTSLELSRILQKVESGAEIEKATTTE